MSKAAATIVSSITSAFNRPTSLALENRLLRKAKEILTQGILVGLVVAIIHLDFHKLLRRRIQYDDKLDIAFKGDDIKCAEELAKFITDGGKNCEDLLEYMSKKKKNFSNLDHYQVIIFFWDPNYTTNTNLYISAVMIAITLPVLSGLFHFFHALYFVNKHPQLVPNEKIEKAYEYTNRIPIFDTIIELKYAWLYGSKLILIVNMLVFGFILWLVGWISVFMRYRFIESTLLLGIAVVNAVYSFYTLIGESNEYWVFCYTATQSDDAILKKYQDDSEKAYEEAFNNVKSMCQEASLLDSDDYINALLGFQAENVLQSENLDLDNNLKFSLELLLILRGYRDKVATFVDQVQLLDTGSINSVGDNDAVVDNNPGATAIGDPVVAENPVVTHDPVDIDEIVTTADDSDAPPPDLKLKDNTAKQLN